ARGTVGGPPVAREPGRADHEVDVRRTLVDAVDLARVDQEGEARAERDVARRVLVEQRVVEDGAERADPALAVDERELAETTAGVVHREAGAESLDVLVRVDLDGDAVLEADAEAADDRAVLEHERRRRGHATLGPVRGGGRE